MMARHEGREFYVEVGSYVAGQAWNALTFSYLDLRRLLLLGDKTLANYFNNALLSRYVDAPQALLGMAVTVGGDTIEIEPSMEHIPRNSVELHVGRFAMEWLCQLDTRHGQGTLAEFIRKELLPYLHPVD